MMNEILLILSLVVSFGSALVLLRFFGKSGLFAWIGISAVLANIEVTVLVHAFGMDQTLGNTLFASSFLATDIISELYGRKDADKGVWVGVITSLIFIAFSTMWMFYTPSPQDYSYPSLKALFSNTPRILTSSLVAYIISEFFDVRLYHFWWNLTTKISGSKDRLLWFRNNFSTLISQAINITIFNFGSFYGCYSLSELIGITLSCYVIYVFTSFLDTPFMYLARKIKA